MQNPINEALYHGKWQSKFHQISIRFNENAWRLVNDGHDNQQGCLFGIFSEKDGASFSLDLSLKDSNLEYNYEFAEAEFFARMFNLDNECAKDGEFNLSISGLAFECSSYFFNNRKFGPQTVIRAMLIAPEKVIGIGMAWPRESVEVFKVPPKFQILLDQLKIE